MKLVRRNREHRYLENTFRIIDVRPVKTQIIFRCKDGQILLFVVTNRHVNSSSWRDYKSLVKYIMVSMKVLLAFCGISDLGLHCLLRPVCPNT